MECFSFHPRKLLTAGEGGAITTNNDEYAEKLNVKLAHGAALKDGKMDFITYGYNYRLPELQCLMLIKQLEKLDEIVKERIAIQKALDAQISEAGYVAQKCADNATHNIQSLVFTVPEGVKRDQLVQYLKDKEIESTIGTYCLSNCSYYKEKYNSVQPNALYLEQNTITLPCYAGVDTDKIAAAILKEI